MGSEIDLSRLGGHVGVGVRLDLFLLRLHIMFLFLLFLELDRTSQTEITKLDFSESVIDEDIFRFQVSVEDIAFLEIVESKEDLEDNTLN